MSIKFNYTAHKEMWIWIAKNPTKHKMDWPGWEKWGSPYVKISAGCFACQYDLEQSMTAISCTNCPLVWSSVPKLNSCVASRDTIYCRFCDARNNENYRLASKLAWRIAHLKVREGVECV